MTDLKHQIEDNLADFKGRDLKQADTGLLNTLGYRSKRTLDHDNSPKAFRRVEANRQSRSR